MLDAFIVHEAVLGESRDEPSQGVCLDLGFLVDGL